MIILLIVIIFVLPTISNLGTNTSDYLKGSAAGIDSPLENSRFLTEKERDTYFPSCTYETISSVKKDGVPVRALVGKNGKLNINFLSGAHSLIIGATGSGKTTTFVNPMIQLLASTNCGSSMIMTDPKGELFDLHSKYLAERGYKVLLLDLRDTYNSSRWNPLDSIWDMYQEYINTGKKIIMHRDSMSLYPDLKQVDGSAPDGEVWCEYNGIAYADARHCYDEVSVAKQKIYDEMYEDLNDLIAGICPITNEKDPLWEKGARSIILATCLAMLEDSEDEKLGMTREKFGQMITVGRSRKIWFNMIVQSYTQLNNVYGEQVADIVKSNCGIKMFIDSNDIGTCKEFSELCGNMTVKTSSTSSSTGSKEGEMNISTQTQTRPLIYPSELQKAHNSFLESCKSSSRSLTDVFFLF